MLYSLERDGGGPFSGLLADDNDPTHRDCGGVLREVGGPIWNCTDCDQSGCLQVRRTIPELIARRWSVLPAQPAFSTPPYDPREWEGYLHSCFPNGALLMVAEGRDGYPIREENEVTVSDVVDVLKADQQSAVISVWDVANGRQILLYDVVMIEPVRPGVLALKNGSGKCFRLDAHLTEPEVAYLHNPQAAPALTPEQIAEAAYLRGDGPEDYPEAPINRTDDQR